MAPPAGHGGQTDPPHLGPLVRPTLGVVDNDVDQYVEASYRLLGRKICPQATGNKVCCFLFLFLCPEQKKMAPIRDSRKLRGSGLVGLATNQIPKA